MARKFLNGVDLDGQSATGLNAYMTTGKLLGRSSSGTGTLEEIVIGSGLSLSSGTLTTTIDPVIAAMIF